MILYNNGDVENKSDDDDEKMLLLEDVNDEEVEYLFKDESLRVSYALSVEAKEDELKAAKRHKHHNVCFYIYKKAFFFCFNFGPLNVMIFFFIKLSTNPM